MVDVERMRRAFVNLIENAVEAMPQGAQLTVQGKESHGNSQVTFSDLRTGITEDDTERVWAPLSAMKEDGSGLSISRRIAGSHKGYISSETVVGNSISFTVTIPVRERKHD
jgi:two-component system, sporulation sensor kinase E